MTARGSKGLPGRDLRPLAGEPLMRSARSTPLRDSRGLRSSRALHRRCGDSRGARSLGCDVPPCGPPSSLAARRRICRCAHAVDWLHDHEGYRPDAVMILQPTSPLRPAGFAKRWRCSRSSGAHSVVSVGRAPISCRCARFRSTHGTRRCSSPASRCGRHHRRQETPQARAMNGAIYLFAHRALGSEAESLRRPRGGLRDAVRVGNRASPP